MFITVCADTHPRHCAWLQWNSGASRLHVASFEVSTPIIVRNIGVYIGRQSRPIILVFNKFLGFLVTWVSSNGRIMMGSDDMHVETLSVRNIHLTGGIVEEAIVFLADSFLLA